MNLFKKIMPYSAATVFLHKSNWVVPGALFWVSSQLNSAAQSFVAIRRFHCIKKKKIKQMLMIDLVVI